MAALTRISPGLDRNQITFLENNFVVYDPLNRECNQDFSGLDNCQVILIGELHYSSILKAIQRKFLEIMIDKQTACVLVEGLLPGETLNAQERPGWQGLPSTLEVRGADIRDQRGAAQFIKWEKLNHRYIELKWADKELISEVFHQIATILNDHFKSNSSGVDPQNKVVLVTDEVLQAVGKLLGRLKVEQEQRDEENVKIHAQMNAAIEEKDKAPTVVKSNQVLFQEIEKASKQFSKVIAIFGKSHFICDDELMRALDRARLSYVILLANAQRENEASDEILWAAGNPPMVQLTVKGTKEERTIRVPKIFQSYFHSAIQSICQAETKEPIVLDIQKILQLEKQGKTLDFPAGQDIHFEHAALADFLRLQELSHGSPKETKLPEAQSLALKTHIVLMLSNILMPGGLKVESLLFDGQLRVGHTCLQNKLVLDLSSDKPFHLTLAKDSSLGYAGHLFQEMKRLKMKTYSVDSEKRLYFLDLSDEERERIKGSPIGMSSWLGSKLPPLTQLSIEGQIAVRAESITLCKGSPETKGIVLTSQTGFTFTLS